MTPYPLGALGIVEVDRRHKTEILGYVPAVYRLDGGIAFHVRLSETDIDMEVGVRLGRC